MRRAAKGRTRANYTFQFSLAFGDSPSSETVSHVNGKSAQCERSWGTPRVVLRRNSLVESESTGFGEHILVKGTSGRRKTESSVSSLGGRGSHTTPAFFPLDTNATSSPAASSPPCRI